MKIHFENAEATAKTLRLALRALSADAEQHAAVWKILLAMQGDQSVVAPITYKGDIEMEWDDVAPLMDARVKWEIAAFRAMELDWLDVPTAEHVAEGKSCQMGFEWIKLQIFGERLAND